MTEQLFQIYAKENDRIIHISEASADRRFRYTCPACGESLIVDKGPNGIPCFSHRSGKPCENGIRHSLCLGTTVMLSLHKPMTLPPVTINFPSGREPILLSPGRTIEFDCAQLDTSINDNLPVIIARKDRKELYVAVITQPLFYLEDIEKIIDSGVSTIVLDLREIDCSLPQDQLEERILRGKNNQFWIFNTLSDYYLKEFIAASERYRIVRWGDYLHTEYCPLSLHTRNNHPYADFLEDCRRCRYFISQSSESVQRKYIHSDFTGEYIYCTGKRQISTLRDLEKYKITE